MRTKIKKALLLSVGWAFIGLGIIGLFLPVLQGILFLLIGLLILSSEYAWAHGVLERLRKRFPVIARRVDEGLTKARAWLR